MKCHVVFSSVDISDEGLSALFCRDVRPLNTFLRSRSLLSPLLCCMLCAGSSALLRAGCISVVQCAYVVCQVRGMTGALIM